MKHTEDDSNQKIKIILVKLLGEHRLGTKSDTEITLTVDAFLLNTGVNTVQLKKIIGHLIEKGIVASLFTKVPGVVGLHDYFSENFNIWNVKVPKTFRLRAEDYIEYLDGQSGYKPDAGSILYLDGVGNFWHGEKEGNFCYSMDTTKRPFAIIKYLANNDGYQRTKDLASFLGVEKAHDVMIDIGKIKSKINSDMKLSDVIENEPGLGYRINPKYKIIEAK
ncbi:MAG: hypothetical protein WCO12_02160 [bacterium]